MHCSTSSHLSRAAAMLMTILTLFASVCIGGHAPGRSAILPRSSTCSAPQNYTVAAGESCQDIAQKYSVSTNDIIALNCLNPQGTNLLTNSTIFLPGCCQTYTVKERDNCTSIASSTPNTTLTNFYAFNPAINSNCSNLLFGTNVCLSPPQGTPFNTPVCPTTNSTSSTSASMPSPSLASGTNSTCASLYTAKTGDTCNSIAPQLNLTDFRQINPSVNEGCTNLIPGVEYCVRSS